MIKNVFYQIITYIITTVCYLTLGLVIPILINIEIPLIFIFSWVIAPIVTTILVSYFLKCFKANRTSLYTVLSFTLNLIIILIYTWVESRKPYIEGDFMDFGGLAFLVNGIGQIMGILFSFAYRRKKHE